MKEEILKLLHELHTILSEGFSRYNTREPKETERICSLNCALWTNRVARLCSQVLIEGVPSPLHQMLNLLKRHLTHHSKLQDVVTTTAPPSDSHLWDDLRVAFDIIITLAPSIVEVIEKIIFT